MSEYMLTKGNATATGFKHDISAVCLCAAETLKKTKSLFLYIFINSKTTYVS